MARPSPAPIGHLLLRLGRTPEAVSRPGCLLRDLTFLFDRLLTRKLVFNGAQLVDHDLSRHRAGSLGISPESPHQFGSACGTSEFTVSRGAGSSSEAPQPKTGCFR